MKRKPKADDVSLVLGPTTTLFDLVRQADAQGYDLHFDLAERFRPRKKTVK